MPPGPVRRALVRAPRPVVAALVGTVVCGVLLAGCASDDGTTEGGDGISAPPGPTDDASGATTDAGPSRPEPTEDPDVTGQPAGTEPPVATSEPPGATGALTEQESGSRVTLAVGEERSLQLGSAWSWSEPVLDGAAVTLTPVDYLVDPGYVEWLVTGATVGSTTVEVVGEPVCGDTTVCPPTTVTLEVDVTD